MGRSRWEVAQEPIKARSTKVSGPLERLPRALLSTVCIVLTISRVVDMFKSLGCNVDLPTPAEREKMGIKLADANKFRKATLKAPLKFPKTKRRGPAKR